MTSRRQFLLSALAVALVGNALVTHHDRTPEQRRRLQSGSVLTGFFEFLIPWFRPNQYPMQPIDSFDLFEVCTDIRMADCDEANVIQFTNNETPGPNDFKYHDSGPPSMQGVFWAQMTLLDVLLGPTDLLSFAKTRHGGGVQTGVLETDENGYEYVARPIGDHTWSRERTEPSFYLTFFDSLYLFDLVEGTIEEPLRFNIVPSFKVFFSCFRFNFGRFLTSFIYQFDMVLITDPDHPYKIQYPDSVVWERGTIFLGLFPFTYPAIQIVDGNGDPIPTAFDAWRDEIKTAFIIGLREDGIDDLLVC